MSAFLGPIHHWLFNKIEIEDSMVEVILQLSEKNGWDVSLREQLSSQYGELEKEPLEDIIDGSNIHGWLQERVSLVESRLALSVTKLTKEHPERIEEICQLLSQKGREYAIIPNNDLAAVYKQIEDSLLDGMPCDGVNKVVTRADDEFVWERTYCVHEQYWNAVNGDVSVYYVMRKAWLDGALSNSGIVLEVTNDDIYRLSYK